MFQPRGTTPFLLLGILLMVQPSCDSDDDDSSENSGNEMSRTVRLPGDGEGFPGASGTNASNETEIPGGAPSAFGSGEASDGSSDASSEAADRAAAEAFIETLPEALCSFWVRCGRAEAGDASACIEDIAPEIREDVYSEGRLCDGIVAFYTANRAAIDGCLANPSDSCRTDDLSEFCPVFEDFNPEEVCTSEPSSQGSSSSSPSEPTTSSEGGPNTLAANVVGGWRTIDQACADDYNWLSTLFLCPGNSIRGGNESRMGSRIVELVCGTYDATPARFENCDDQYGCFNKLDVAYRSTLIIGSHSDVDPNATMDLWQLDRDHILKPIACSDGSNSYQVLARLVGDQVTEESCISDACPRRGSGGGSSGGGSGYGECGTDCDCGHCWYCESGTCRYGGEGPVGCYRGCGW